MKSSNLVLMTVAVAAVGILAMPSTISLFAGQHTWYNISGDHELPCRKCHAEVFQELQNSAFQKWDGGGFGSGGEVTVDNIACYGCHRANASITYADVGDTVTAVTPGKQAHAASTVACMLCHQVNATQATRNPTGSGSLAGFFAGGFDQPSNSPYNYTKNKVKGVNGTHAAHQTFIQSAINDTTMEDANEACIACHTHIPVKINWTHRFSLEFNVTPESGYWPPTHFNVTDWSFNGTYKITVYGGRNGTSDDTGAKTQPPGWPGAWPGKNESS